MNTRISKSIIIIGLSLSLFSNFCIADQTETENKKQKLYNELISQVQANENASPEIKSFTINILLKIWDNPVIANAIEIQNKKGITLDKIKEIDKQWIEAEEELPIHTEITNNDCSHEIVRLTTLIPAIGETFAMDNQGANVGQNTITSDYWQGDEPKWQVSYNNGSGGMYIEAQKLDKSTNAVDQKVAIPVINDKAEVIGAICFGIDTEYASALGKMVDQVAANSNISDEVKKYITNNLITLCTDSTIANEVEAQNAKGMTLDQVKEIDEKWINAEDELPIHVELTSNACAKEIKKLIGSGSAVTEIFVMDNQGANVGQNTLTSDYWQGDEAKWQKSFNDGKGGVDAGEVKFDKSANVPLQQVSLPVLGSKGKVIGAVCVGINIDSINSIEIASDWSVIPK